MCVDIVFVGEISIDVGVLIIVLKFWRLLVIRFDFNGRVNYLIEVCIEWSLKFRWDM